MENLSFSDIVWMALLGGAAAAYLGRYLFRAVRRGRCATCVPDGCGVANQPVGGAAEIRPLHFNAGGGTRTSQSSAPARRRTSSGARNTHRIVGLVGLPLIALLLASGIALLFAEELALRDRSLPARLALVLYNGEPGEVVATARRGEQLAVAVKDGVVTRVGHGLWRGVRWSAGGHGVHDIVWLPEGRLACATDQGVWISADATSWDYLADHSAGVPGGVTRLHLEGGRLWASTTLGPRLSEDGGVSWKAADGSPPAALSLSPESEGPPPIGSAAALLEARGWPTWERLVIDLHAGNLFGGLWRYVVLATWCLLFGLAASGPLVARQRRRHLQERAAARAAKETVG